MKKIAVIRHNINKNTDGVVLKDLPVDSIKPSPNQSRKRFDKMAMYQLSESIKAQWIIAASSSARDITDENTS